MKVLIIKLGALGDVIMATALVRQIQSHHNADELWLLTTPGFAPIFADWPGLQVIAFPRKGMGAMLRLLRWMRTQHFRRVYDLQANDRTGLLCALSGIPERVGNHPRYPYTIHPPQRWDQRSHIFERMNAVLVSARIAPAEARPWLPLSAPGRARVAEWLVRHDLRDGRFAVMHAGASPGWPSKCWPYYADLAEGLAARGVRTVWLGAGADASGNALLAARTGIDATGAFSIAELAELGRHARFAVTNDSGPMHALAASSIPVYAFFGPTDWRRNHALGQGGRVLRNDSPCAACTQRDRATRSDHTCLPGISAAEVLARLAADGLLDQAPGEPSTPLSAS